MKIIKADNGSLNEKLVGSKSDENKSNTKIVGKFFSCEGV